MEKVETKKSTQTAQKALERLNKIIPAAEQKHKEFLELAGEIDFLTRLLTDYKLRGVVSCEIPKLKTKSRQSALKDYRAKRKKG